MTAFLKSFDEYWQTKADIDQKLVPPKPKRKAVVLNYINKEAQRGKFEPPELPELVEERACILASDLERKTEIPEDWCKAIVALMDMQQPKVISNAKWSTIRRVLTYLFSQEYVLLKSMVAHNWTMSHIFGCDSNTPEMAFHNMGLVMLLKETDKLDNISDEAIMIRNSRGVITSYSRPHRNAKNNQVLIYELL